MFVRTLIKKRDQQRSSNKQTNKNKTPQNKQTNKNQEKQHQTNENKTNKQTKEKTKTITKTASRYNTAQISLHRDNKVLLHCYWELASWKSDTYVEKVIHLLLGVLCSEQ